MFLLNILDKLLSIGSTDADSEKLKIKKSSLVLVPVIIGPAAFIWGLLYIYLEHYVSAAIPLSYSVISIFNLLHLYKTKNIQFLQHTQMVLVLLLPFFLMWSLGGFALGSFVFIWAFYAPIASLTYEKRRSSYYWFFAFVFLVVLSVFIDQKLQEQHIACMPQEAILLFYFLNISAGLSGIFFLTKHFIDEKEKSADEILQKEHEALKKTTKELELVNSKLEHLASYDFLTQLPNRYFFRENVKRMMALAKRQKHSVALLFLDLDGFKDVNDKYGHIIGDEVLVAVASRIKFLLREEDIVARIGGDEFAIALGNISGKEYIEMVAQRVLNVISKEYECLPNENCIGVSIGISIFPDDADELDTLINNADKAMYEVKAKGKNAYKIYT